jgi:DNA-binding beta-propeller fold protein YncE
MGKVWISDSASGTVSELDPTTGVITGPIRVGADPIDITTGFGKVWVADRGDGTIARIDPATKDASLIRVRARVAFIVADPGSHALWIAVAEQ